MNNINNVPGNNTKSDIPERYLELEGSFNVRDVGGYATVNGGQTRWRMLLRADSLHRLTPAAQQTLLTTGLRTIIDLRRGSELEQAPNVFAQSAALRYVNISLIDESSGTRSAEPPEDLELLYRLILDHFQSKVRQVVTHLVESDGPTLVHCTAGKDRTGVIVALLLSLVGVPAATIAEDYALTAHYFQPMLETLRETARQAGYHSARFERMLESAPEAMLNTLTYLDRQYGGTEPYFQTIGITDAQIAHLRTRLVEL